MLAGQPERLAEAFALLDPSHRALLELSLRREVADPALAELLRTDVETVGRQRIEALESLGSVLDTTAAEVEEALIDRWRGETDAEEPDAEAETGGDEAEAEEGPEAEEEPDVEPTEEPDPAAPPPVPATTVRPKLEGSSRPRRRGVWLGLAAGIALVILLVSIGGGDDDEEPARPADTQASTETAEDPPPPDDGAAPVKLAAVLESGNAGGTVQVVESGSRPRVALRLRGLSDAGYTLWLYNSIGDAQALASFRGPAPFVRARLPEGYLGFGFLDVSLEPEDGNSNHSGASVLRVPTKSLPAG